ncbi:MAG: glycosyltransferase [Verrucomicrobia bacterium]|nr:glycosyltransferase [Verrucomicrobiota bacterium]
MKFIPTASEPVSRMHEERYGNEPGGRLILFLGAGWWGSDARALAAALRRRGHALIEVSSEDSFPLNWSIFSLRILRRLCRPQFVANYNRAILRHLENPAIDFLLVFKGTMLRASTLEAFRRRGFALYCFYPDVSFLDHGPEIWSCLPLYDCLFTTKSFHVDDPALKSRVRALRLVMHGFDPEVHRPIPLSKETLAHYGCDVSFVGCWSPKKEKFLGAIVQVCPGNDVRIWGPGWERSAANLRRCWRGGGAYGDELSVIYGATKVNLGLLSEPGGGTRVGDSVTTRTWQIPAAGGFLLHEDTVELGRFFSAGHEVAVFRSEADLPEKVKYYLANPEERLRIRAAGHRRCRDSRYTRDGAADEILAFHDGRGR